MKVRAIVVPIVSDSTFTIFYSQEPSSVKYPSFTFHTLYLQWNRFKIETRVWLERSAPGIIFVNTGSVGCFYQSLDRYCWRISIVNTK